MIAIRLELSSYLKMIQNLVVHIFQHKKSKRNYKTTNKNERLIWLLFLQMPFRTI